MRITSNERNPVTSAFGGIGSVPGVPDAAILQVAHLPDIDERDRLHDPRTRYLFDMPDAGRFLARAGSTIEFALAPGADLGLVKLTLNGSARSALIHQRGELPFHAATLLPPGGGQAIAICGPSGAGKSTLAMELSRRGWVLLADDTTRVTWENGAVMAWPSRDTIKLWRASCDHFGIETVDLEQVTKRLDKFYVPVAAHDQPVRLATVVEVTKDSRDDLPAIGARIALISRNTHKAHQIVALGTQAAHVQIAARVAGACGFVRLFSDHSIPVATLADRIESLPRSPGA